MVSPCGSWCRWDRILFVHKGGYVGVGVGQDLFVYKGVIMIGKTAVLEDGRPESSNIRASREGSTELESDSRRLLPAQPKIIHIKYLNSCLIYSL